MIKLKPLIKESMTEVHFFGTNPIADGDEVIVQYDIDTWEPIAAYVWHDSPLIKFDPEEWEVSNSKALEYRWKWKPSKMGKLFYHVVATKRYLNTFVWWIEELGYTEARDV